MVSKEDISAKVKALKEGESYIYTGEMADITYKRITSDEAKQEVLKALEYQYSGNSVTCSSSCPGCNGHPKMTLCDEFSRIMNFVYICTSCNLYIHECINSFD